MNTIFQNMKEILEKRQRFIIEDSRLTSSAVLLLLFLKNNEPNGIFTKRTKNLKKHKGEISLPGGGIHKADKNLLETALRETEEEIGVERSKIHVLGELDDLYTMSKYIITPFVGYIQYPFKSKINPREVEELIEVPLSVFQSKDNFREDNWDFKGEKYPVYYYDYNNGIKIYTIWGATGYILNNFIEIVFNFNPSSTNYKRDNPEIVFKT